MSLSGGAQEADNRASAAGLAPHKALYEIKLVGAKSGSQIVNISGQMFYDWKPSCEAWISNHRFDLLYEYADSPAMRLKSDFSTYEAFDGTDMHFTSQRKRDGQLFEEVRGHAMLNADAGGGNAEYSIPEGVKYDIPPGGVFPMGHTLGLLEQIKKNAKFYNATIFDGSDNEGPININAFIGKPVDRFADVKNMENVDKALLDSPAREVQLAFFPLDNDSATSDYEMDLVFHENGVISSMLVRYEDFTVTQTLKALEPLEAEQCAQE
ncbi:MAG: DUF1849 family protein [Alphaproteobacteria bacterium]|nr:DUF1849 family protein [Alphaproteobacteria bacterium]